MRQGVRFGVWSLSLIEALQGLNAPNIGKHLALPKGAWFRVYDLRGMVNG